MLYTLITNIYFEFYLDLLLILLKDCYAFHLVTYRKTLISCSVISLFEYTSDTAQ